MDIFYDSLDTMMESLGGDSDLKKRGCNELAKDPKPKGPIALEEAAAEDGKLYLGQGSNVEVKSKLEITCQIYGRDCTALASWKKQPSNEEAMKNFKVQCLDVEMNSNNIRRQIEDFDDVDSGFIEKKHQCFQTDGDRTSLIKSKRDRNKEGYSENDCPFSVLTGCTWGNWVKTEVNPNPPETKEQCNNGEQGTKSIRFCRRDDCLFMEVEMLTWDTTKNTCTRFYPTRIPTSGISNDPKYENCN